MLMRVRPGRAKLAKPGLLEALEERNRCHLLTLDQANTVQRVPQPQAGVSSYGAKISLKLYRRAVQGQVHTKSQAQRQSQELNLACQNSKLIRKARGNRDMSRVFLQLPIVPPDTLTNLLSMVTLQGVVQIIYKVAALKTQDLELIKWPTNMTRAAAAIWVEKLRTRKNKI